MIENRCIDEKIIEQKLIELHKNIQIRRPIIHCITNAVTVNDCANILLAAGASPTMAHHPLEVAEITEGTSALVCNFGAIDDYEAMLNAGRRARELSHAIVVDPVGVGGSTYRRQKCRTLIEEISPTCIRGNHSEIRALIEDHNTVTGVDAAPEDSVQQQELLENEMERYAADHHTIVVASGKTDIITDGRQTMRCTGGDPLMARITGSGCMSSVMLGAFLAVEQSVESAAAAVRFMGLAGELAAARTRETGGGTMTFRALFIDAVSLMKPSDIV